MIHRTIMSLRDSPNQMRKVSNHPFEKKSDRLGQSDLESYQKKMKNFPSQKFLAIPQNFEVFDFFGFLGIIFEINTRLIRPIIGLQMLTVKIDR